ncbi:metallophosphoesterase [Mariniblastus fucicola]|uniref:Calcineurin-like phosphoesterase n=1 Tax=Mariniblastus fucicola TaxID=980251 RepID=A0A5B9P889_9BACT|nr:metallophosphoesterase [Mariniblastus fucicola]QEG22917.1 Calcineurin-like phosphoesterase [Mariniblastus fucicola]
MRLRFSPLAVLALLLCSSVSSLFAQQPVADWTFVPDYVLPAKAENHPGPRIDNPKGNAPLVEIDSASLRFNSELPTERLRHLLPSESIPREAFSVEMWILHHVNQPVGAVVAAKGKVPGDTVPWSLGFHNWKSSFSTQGIDGAMVQLQSRIKRWGGYKQRWIHLVAAYDGDVIRMFVNGEEVASGHMHHDKLAWPEHTELELAAYMNSEPFMQWANLVHRVKIYTEALSETQINRNFFALQKVVEEGRLYDGLFHFTAGPYLNYMTQESVNVVWETDRDATAKLEWGTTAELGEEMELSKSNRLQTATIKGLKPATPYFYRIRSNCGDEQIDSGLLTFKTAVKESQPFKFAVIGDTESRPHVNDRLAKLIWSERPNFLINLGDLTDAGKEPHRYEWTHEYFIGMNQLTSRVPVFAVPGNGEDDLYWYNHYHDYPEPEGFYKFRFGDAAFFMLDSNQRKEEFVPGGKQYEWLKKELAACDAKWKFACHHHAAYTGEEDDYGDTWKEGTTFGDPAVQKIVPLYEEFGVDMVMFGHLHLYERSHPMKGGQVDFAAGTIHLLAGGGGGNIEDFAPTPTFFSAKVHRGHHYVIIESQNNTLTMRMYDTNGAIRDSLVLSKQDDGKVTMKAGDTEQVDRK